MAWTIYIVSLKKTRKKKRDEGRKGEEGWGREKGGWKKLRREWGQ